MLFEYIELGSSPTNEPCVCVSSTEDYLDAMKDECMRYKILLEKLFPIPDDLTWCCKFAVKSFNHDFGVYYEVVLKYFNDSEEALDFALNVEANLPETW